MALALGLLPYPILSLAGLPPLAVSVVVALPLLFWTYAVTGLIAWWRRPRNRVGGLLVWTGMTVWTIAIGNTTVPAFQAMLPIFSSLILAALAHLVLAYPAGRLRSRLERGLTLGLYLATTIAAVPGYVFDPATEPKFLSLVDNPGLLVAGKWLYTVSVDGLLLAVAVVVLVRLARDGYQRRSAAVVSIYGVLVLLFVPASALVTTMWWPEQSLALQAIQLIATAVLPIVLLTAFLLGSFRRTAELEELGAWLGAIDLPDFSIQGLLADALDDPTLVVTYWSTELGTWVLADGTLIDDVPPVAGRTRSAVKLSGTPVASIEYDNRILRNPHEIEHLVGLVALVLEREQLAAELRASRQAVVESRERLTDAADNERRRIARDLHDGLQARLLLLGIAAQRIVTAPSHEVPARATALRDDTDQAAAELRALLRNLVPPALIELGVVGAVEELIESMPIPTRFTADVPRRIDRSAEMTAYLVAAEALSNVVKHSAASQCTVVLRAAQGWLHVSVSDNGNGGVDIHAGTGLTGITDRVAASGGRSTLSTPTEGGTTLWAQIPYRS